MKIGVELLHLLAHDERGSVGPLPVAVGLGISEVNHGKQAGEVNLAVRAGRSRELVGQQPVHRIQHSVSARPATVMVWLWSSASPEPPAGAISPNA